MISLIEIRTSTDKKNILSLGSYCDNREMSPNDTLADTAGRRTLLITGRRNYELKTVALGEHLGKMATIKI